MTKWLIPAALIVALAVVVARATMLESLREPFGPNSPLNSHGAGPGTGLLLDLLCCAPALLVLLRRVVVRDEVVTRGAIAGSIKNAKDPHPNPLPEYRERGNEGTSDCAVTRSWACRLGLGLGILALASTLWASDQFGAMVSAAHFFSAMTLIWAAAQIVTTWQRFRLVAAVCAGLLAVCIVQAVMWRFVEMPATLANFEHNRVEFLRQMGWQPGDFAARQFENKIKNMEMLGFDASANSFAALMVLLLGVTAGLIIQRAKDGQPRAAAGMAALIPLTGWILFYTQSKAAFFTPLIIGVILTVIWKFRAGLAEHSLRLFGMAGIVVLIGTAATIGYGIAFGRLPTASLFFRWRYWVAAARMHMAFPFLGVGWNNFGAHYLQYRLTDAAEEVQDPHNFVLRFITELGMIGGMLAIAWLGRLWWEMTVKAKPNHANDPLRGTIGWIALIAGAGMLLALVAASDFSQGLDAVVMEVLKRLLFFCVLMLVGSLAAIASVRDMRIDSRPAEWVLYAALASLAAFFIHNLIEFSLFETGPLMVFAMVAGSAIGMRNRGTERRGTEGLRVQGFKGWPMARVGVAGLLWIAAAVFLAIPAAIAQSLASDGDDLVRAGHIDDAEVDYQRAAEWVPFNADYFYRAAMALAYKPRRGMSDRQVILGLINEAIARDPTNVAYPLSRARMEAETGDASAAKADFTRALDLNPNEVSIRLDFGQALLGLHEPAEAAKEFDLALKYNSMLPEAEPKRMNEGSLRGQWAAALFSAGQKAAAKDQALSALAANNKMAADDLRRLSEEEVRQLKLLIDAAGKGN